MREWPAVPSHLSTLDNPPRNLIAYLEGHLSVSQIPAEERDVDYVHAKMYVPGPFQDALECTLFNTLCFYNRLRDIESLQFDTETLQTAITRQNYLAVKLAIFAGHLEMARFLCAQLPEDKKPEMLRACFDEAVIHDRYDIARAIVADAQYDNDKLRELLLYEGENALYAALEADHLSFIKWAAEIRGHAETVAFIRIHLKYIYGAAYTGQLDILQYLMALVPHMNLLHIDEGLLLRQAVCGGSTTSLDYLLPFYTHEDIRVYATVENNQVFDVLVARNLFSYLQQIEAAFEPQALGDIVRANNYKLISQAAGTGNLALVEHLEGHLGPENPSDLLLRNPKKYSIMYQAILSGSLAMVQHFEARLSAEERDELMRGDDKLDPYGLIGTAQYYEHHDIVLYILDNYPNALAHFASGDHCYTERNKALLPAFTAFKLPQIKAQHAAHQDTTVPFDLSEAEAKKAIIIISDLIRRSRQYGQATEVHDTLMQDMQFLISIPAVQKRLHENFSEKGHPIAKNELFHFAARRFNTLPVAVGLLLKASEAVRMQAQATASDYSCSELHVHDRSHFIAAAERFEARMRAQADDGASAASSHSPEPRRRPMVRFSDVPAPNAAAVPAAPSNAKARRRERRKHLQWATPQ